VAAKALYRDDGLGHWRDCRMIDYDEAQDKFKVEWIIPAKETEWIPRCVFYSRIFEVTIDHRYHPTVENIDLDYNVSTGSLIMI
jgi:hypothetical protein